MLSNLFMQVVVGKKKYTQEEATLASVKWILNIVLIGLWLDYLKSSPIKATKHFFKAIKQIVLKFLK